MSGCSAWLLKADCELFVPEDFMELNDANLGLIVLEHVNDYLMPGNTGFSTESD